MKKYHIRKNVGYVNNTQFFRFSEEKATYAFLD